MYAMTVEILRHPSKEDWERCKLLALNTMGKKYTGTEVTDEWKNKMLKAKHSPIRTLMFTIRITVPSFVSTHYVRHKIGVEHYVQSQRNDRQSEYDRELAPQNTMVSHIMDINAEQLMFMANRRLCGMADATTRFVMTHICLAVVKTNPEFKPHLKPMCEHLHECPEFRPCGHWDKIQKTEAADAIFNDMISRSKLLAAYDKAHVGPPGGARKLIEEAPSILVLTPNNK